MTHCPSLHVVFLYDSICVELLHSSPVHVPSRHKTDAGVVFTVVAAAVVFTFITVEIPAAPLVELFFPGANEDVEVRGTVVDVVGGSVVTDTTSVVHCMTSKKATKYP